MHPLYSAFGSAEAKEIIVARAITHRDAGHYHKDARFNPQTQACCLLGGALDDYDPSRFAFELDVAPEVPHLLEAIYENLSFTRTELFHEAEAFAVESLNIIPVYGDTRLASARLAYDMFTNLAVHLHRKATTRGYYLFHGFIAMQLQNAPPLDDVEWLAIAESLNKTAATTTDVQARDTLKVAATYAMSSLSCGHDLKGGAASYIYSAIIENLMAPQAIRNLFMKALAKSPVTAPALNLAA